MARRAAAQQASGLSRVDYCAQHDCTGHQATDSVDVPQLVKVPERVNATENKLTIHHEDVVLRVFLPVAPKWGRRCYEVYKHEDVC